MKKIMLIAIVVVGCGGDDGASPAAACRQAVEVTCSKIYECFTEPERTAAGFPATEAACVTEQEQMEGCANQTTENVCDAGETYHANEASSCIDQLGALSCDQVRSGDIEMQAPACDRVCTVE